MPEPVFHQGGVTGPYSIWCGPRALAAVTRVPAEVAARGLETLRQAAGWEPSPGTTADVLGMALLTYGYGIERWSADRGGWREERAEDFGERIRRQYRRGAISKQELDELRRQIESRPRPKPIPAEVKQFRDHCLAVSRERRRLRASRWRYSVQDWLNFRRVGTWILRLESPPHWIAVRNGEVIAGDDANQFGGTPIAEAWRVIPPRPLEKTMTIETQSFLKRAESAKAGDLSEIEIRRLLADLDSAINAAVARQDDLSTNAMDGSPMPGRAAAMAKGPAGVVAADEELREIEAALQILDHARVTAQEAVGDARKREAPPKAADAIRRLPAAVKKLEKLKTQYAAARAEVEQLATQLGQARHEDKDNCPALSDDAFEKLATALWRNRIEKTGPEAEANMRLRLTGQTAEQQQPKRKLEFRGFKGGRHRRLA